MHWERGRLCPLPIRATERPKIRPHKCSLTTVCPLWEASLVGSFCRGHTCDVIRISQEGDQSLMTSSSLDRIPTSRLIYHQIFFFKYTRSIWWHRNGLWMSFDLDIVGSYTILIEMAWRWQSPKLDSVVPIWVITLSPSKCIHWRKHDDVNGWWFNYGRNTSIRMLIEIPCRLYPRRKKSGQLTITRGGMTIVTLLSFTWSDVMNKFAYWAPRNF
jgi:hypothetical protein